MPNINVEFSVEDKFSQRMDEFEARLKKLEGSAAKVDTATMDVGKSADRAGGMFKGFGGAIFIVNQAMQAFQKVAGDVKDALDDIADKERAIIMLGKDAGDALAQFAKESARSLGRSQSDIMKSALKWRESGIGGADIMELTALADRFSNLNPGRDYNDVANALNEAVKSKNVGALADLLGGGEGVEKRLQRHGVERALRSGDITGAMGKFKDIADSFGYTQQKADEMGMTITRKVDRIIDRIKNRVTELFSGIVKRAEPMIDTVMRFLESEEFDIFFDNLQTKIWGVVDMTSEAMSVIGDILTGALEGFHGFYDDIIGGATSIVEMIVGIFVGGFTMLGGVLWNIEAKYLNTYMTAVEMYVNGIIKAAVGIRNIAFRVAYGIKDTVIGVIEDILDAAKKAVDYAANNPIGQLLGIDGIANDVSGVADTIKDTLGELKGGYEEFDAKKLTVDFSDFHLEEFDPIQRAADNIDAVMNWIKSFTVDNRNPEARKIRDILAQIKQDSGKIKGALLHEQDLRWLKERAEQRYVNNINFRQLTPTINVKISGSDATPRNIEKTIERVLKEQASAGTYNVYGENV